MTKLNVLVPTDMHGRELLICLCAVIGGDNEALIINRSPCKSGNAV